MDRSAGIGLSLAPNKFGQFIITKIVPDGPAFQSKEILPGDVLAQVNGTLLEGMSIEQVWSFIVGPPNTRVDLQLFRNRPDYEGAIEPDEIYVSVFRSASTPRQLSPPIISRMSSSPKNWDTSPLRPVHRRTTDAQNTSEFSQYVQRDQRPENTFSPVRRERAWSPANVTRDVSPLQQRPGPLFPYGLGDRSAFDPSRPNMSPPNLTKSRNKLSSPSSGIDVYGVLRDPNRISPSRTTPQKHQVPNAEPYNRRAKSAQDTRRSWSGENRGLFAGHPPQTSIDQGRRFWTPPYIPSTAMRDASPAQQNVGSHGIGIVLYNDDRRDLRILEITQDGPADSQGCPFIPGDIVVAIDGRFVRGRSMLEARSLILGRFGTPVEISIFREVQSLEGDSSKSMVSLSFTIVRGVVKTSRENAASKNDSKSSQIVRKADRNEVVHGQTIGNEEFCGIGIYVEQILGCFVVKKINQAGPASLIPPTFLSAGDYIVGIDGTSTQGLNIDEVKYRIVGVKGTFVVLYLRRFFSANGEFSHIFRTRIRRDYHLPATEDKPDPVSAAAFQNRVRNVHGEDVLVDGDSAVPAADLRDSNVYGYDQTPGSVKAQAADLYGVGVELMALDQVLMIKSVVPGGPAYRSSLISKGDILYRIDYQAVSGFSVDAVMSMLNGPARSSVVLGIVKPKHRLKVNVRLQRESQSASQSTVAQARPSQEQRSANLRDRVSKATVSPKGPKPAVSRSSLPAFLPSSSYYPPWSTPHLSGAQPPFTWNQPIQHLTPFMFSPFPTIPFPSLGFRY